MGHPIRPRTQAELAAEERLREITAHLPEVKVATDKFGHVTFRIKDKPFVFVGAAGEASQVPEGVGFSTKTDKAHQAKLIASGRYTRTRYIGQHGWVSFDLADVGWEEVEERVIESFWRTAPKRLIKSHGPG